MIGNNINIGRNHNPEYSGHGGIIFNDMSERMEAARKAAEKLAEEKAKQEAKKAEEKAKEQQKTNTTSNSNMSLPSVQPIIHSIQPIMPEVKTASLQSTSIEPTGLRTIEPTILSEPTPTVLSEPSPSLTIASEPSIDLKTTSVEVEPSSANTQIVTAVDPISGDIVNSLTGEIIMPKDMMSNEYRSLAGLAKLKSSTGQSWIDAANTTVQSPISSKSIGGASLPSTSGLDWISAAKASTKSSTFSLDPVGIKGSLPQAYSPALKSVTNAAQVAKVGNILGSSNRGTVEKNPILTAKVPRVNTDIISKISGTKKKVTKENIVQKANKSNYELQLVQVGSNAYKIKIYDRYAIGSRPRASTGIMTKSQALTEFTRLKGEPKKVTL